MLLNSRRDNFTKKGNAVLRFLFLQAKRGAARRALKGKGSRKSFAKKKFFGKRRNKCKKEAITKGIAASKGICFDDVHLSSRRDNFTKKGNAVLRFLFLQAKRGAARRALKGKGSRKSFAKKKFFGKRRNKCKKEAITKGIAASKGICFDDVHLSSRRDNFTKNGNAVLRFLFLCGINRS